MRQSFAVARASLEKVPLPPLFVMMRPCLRTVAKQPHTNGTKKRRIRDRMRGGGLRISALRRPLALRTVPRPLNLDREIVCRAQFSEGKYGRPQRRGHTL